MKYLPERFPIRYAIVAERIADYDNNDWEDSRSDEPNEIFVHRQLTNYLRSHALTKDSLRLGSVGIAARIAGVNLINLSKLAEEQAWVDLAKKNIEELFPDEKILISQHTGNAYLLGLYSYTGAAEQPSFFNAYRHREDSKYIGKKFGLNQTAVNFLYRMYDNLTKGLENEKELAELAFEYGSPSYITVPYSGLWKALDKGACNGIIPNLFSKQESLEYTSSIVEEEIKEGSKIQVIVCKKWQALFVEEIQSLFRISSFCNNCQKPLPFDYKGKYCIDLPENKDCIRQRNRIRKSQSK